MDAVEFTDWLRRQGADVLAPTNAYEIARFRARGAVHVVYQRQNGHITAQGFAQEALTAFKQNRNIGMGFTGWRRTFSSKVKASLLARDGDACFFCSHQMPENDVTIEHLVALGKGGPNHMDNLALAHYKCNRDADNLPLMEKIRIHREGWYAKTHAQPPSFLDASVR